MAKQLPPWMQKGGQDGEDGSSKDKNRKMAIQKRLAKAKGKKEDKKEKAAK